MDTTAPDIASLDKRVDTLSENDRVLFNRFYSLCMQNSSMRIPETMREWTVKQFGSLETISSQRIVRLTNLITGEETIYNSIRAHEAQRHARENRRLS